VETLQDAHDVMERTLSSNVAPHAFGMALLCAGQLSTFTGTISGQVSALLLCARKLMTYAGYTVGQVSVSDFCLWNGHVHKEHFKTVG